MCFRVQRCFNVFIAITNHHGVCWCDFVVLDEMREQIGFFVELPV